MRGRVGGGRRSHRVARRNAELARWHDQGVRTIVSAMRSRHALTEYAQLGYATRWFPLRDAVQARGEIPDLANEVALLMAREHGAVLVHCDRVSEWLAAIDAAIRLRLGLAGDVDAALGQAEADGMRVGDLARELLDSGNALPPAA